MTVRRADLQTEFVAGLGLVMLAATAILAALLLHAHEARLRSLLGPALLAESTRFTEAGRSAVPGTQWWRVFPDGSARAAAAGDPAPPDDRSLALAAEAR
ncbi:MAG: hypothetical protein MJE12_17325, partial [Alphaproteobacteria bacterium]|nr:hypothetical protein [Alphaproteobacteria bacterium]